MQQSTYFHETFNILLEILLHHKLQVHHLLEGPRLFVYPVWLRLSSLIIIYKVSVNYDFKHSITIHTVVDLPVGLDGQPTGTPPACPTGSVIGVIASGTVPTAFPIPTRTPTPTPTVIG